MRKYAKLALYIPTRGRVDNQITLGNIPKEWLHRTILVCPKSEARAHAKNWPMVAVVAQPDSVKTIADKRKWIFENADSEKILVMDDDLSFCLRRTTLKSFAGYGSSSTDKRWAEAKKKTPGVDGLVKLTDGQHDAKVGAIFTATERMLTEYAHGGIGPRLMNNMRGWEFTTNMRVMYALAYHVPTVLKHCELGRITTREDFDYTLQLMRAGFENAVYTWACVEQYTGYNAPGGASDERTIARSNSDAKLLARLHPGLVRIAEKEYKASWDKNASEISRKRIEVVISWAKAVQQGKCEFL